MTDHLAMILVMLLFVALLFCTGFIAASGGGLIRSGSAHEAQRVRHRISWPHRRRPAA